MSRVTPNVSNVALIEWFLGQWQAPDFRLPTPPFVLHPPHTEVMDGRFYEALAHECQRQLDYERRLPAERETLISGWKSGGRPAPRFRYGAAQADLQALFGLWVDDRLQVVNIKRKTRPPGRLIEAMWGKGHILGNPYYKEARHDRPGCLERFKRRLRFKARRPGPELAALEEIADAILGGERILLGCVCHPLPCHCDEIKALERAVILPRRAGIFFA